MKWLIGILVLITAVEIGLSLAWALGVFEDDEEDMDMKARIKHTDKIIDVEWNMFGWLFDSPEGKRIFNTEELDFLDNDNID